MGNMEMRVKFGDDSELRLTVAEGDTMQEVAAQVRAAKEWDAQQFVRFICAGQELYLDDKASKVSGVVHCIASSAPSHRYPSHKHSMYKNGESQPSAAVDWLEVVDPGTVLMWIFGSILALLWLLFVFYAHMFDKTSVVMLCMMTIAFLIPCVLSYVPCVQLLNGSLGTVTPARQPLYYYNTPAGPIPGPGSAGSGGGGHHYQHQQPYLRSGSGPGISAAAAGGGWAGSAYGTQIPPRPAARVRPGAPAPH